MKSEDVVMILLKSLSSSYKYLITTLETMLMKELTMEYVTTRFLYKMLKMKEKKSQSSDVALVLHQDQMSNLSWQGEAKTCYYYGKPGHIARFCYKTKNNH